VFHTVCEITEEIDILLSDSNTNDDDDANLCDDEDFIQKLAFLAHIFEKLSNFNKSLQDLHIKSLTENDKVDAFMKNFRYIKNRT
jgi:hypothetical protein